MFRIKVCGITTVDDARTALDLGAEAIGLNFYAGSRRYISEAAAHSIAAIVPNDAWCVGVFVNATAAQIGETVDRVPELNAVQLHGDERPSLLAQIPAHVKIVRAFRCGAEGLAPLAEYLAECGAAGRMPDAVLIDAKSQSAGEYGGTGSTADWRRIADERAVVGDMPLILAGGLTPRNVRAAIQAVQPDGVDVASGVEAPTGGKDADLIKRFVDEATSAFQDRG